MIASVQNPRVKKWAELLTKKGREKQQRFLLEGARLVEDALQNGAEVEAVLYQAGREFSLLERLPPHIERWEISEAVLKKLSDTQHSQGILAVVRMRDEKERVDLDKGGLYLLVDRVQDPGNLGTIIRSADAAGVAGVVLGRGTVDLYNPKTVRSTMGSLFHFPIFFASLPEFIHDLKAKGYQVVAATLDADRYYHQVQYGSKTALIVGNEGNGISREILELADLKVKIPIYGKAESLNVAIASALLMYEIQRQGQDF